MLKEIVSISGKPGLFKIITQAKNMIIVESLVDGKRFPAYSRDKVVTLSDIAIYTDSGEIILAEVLEKIKEKEQGNKISDEYKTNNDTLRDYMLMILPDFDQDRVYPNDIKKIINWYNLLVDSGRTKFLAKEDAEGQGLKEETVAPEKEVKKVVNKKEIKVQPKQQSKSVQKKSVTNRKMGG